MKLAASHSTVNSIRSFELHNVGRSKRSVGVSRCSQDDIANLSARRLALRTAAAFDDPQDRQLYYNALIQAGELESALADSNSESTESLADLTDALAFAAFGGGLDKVKQLANALDHIACPNQLTTSPSEGFAYYALNPLDIAKPAQE